MTTRKKGKVVPKKPPYTTGRFVHALPGWAAERITETIVRHSRLEWVLAKVVFNLSEINIKRGRISHRIPSSQYISQLKQHLAASGIRLRGFRFKKFKEELEDAAFARNSLAHSVYVADQRGRVYVQLVTGSWDLGGQFEPMYRAINPETPLLTRSFLNKQRMAVNVALRRALSLQRAANRALFTLQQRRRTDASMDRRNRGSQNELRNLMYPPAASGSSS